MSRPAEFTGRRPMTRQLAYVVGVVAVAGAASMIPAALTAVIYQEWLAAAALFASAAITCGCGGLVAWGFGRQGELTTKEGFAAVGLAWFVLVAFGSLPYLISGAISGVTDAFFEATAGFTTTGASVVANPGSLSHGLLMWRATTQWVGGMGIIVLSVAVLPLLGSGGVQLARAEAPGPEPDRLTPRFRETAKRLWLVYAALTGIEVILLALGDMDLFEAFAHGLTTVSTGGFSTEAGSIGAFGAYTQWVVIAFMFISGASFALHFRALRDPAVYVRSGEFRLYACIVAAAALLIVGGLWVDGLSVGRHLRHAIFTAVTLVTGTGYFTIDYSVWTQGLQILAVGLMFLGGMAGSTAGGIKTFRIGVLTKASAHRLKQLVYPDAVLLTRWDRRPVADPVVRNIQSFFLFYIMAFLGGTFLLAVLESVGGTGTDLVTATSAVASALGNVGPGLGNVGPGGGYVVITTGGKWLLSFIMILGRLEIFPVLLLFTRYLWRR